MDENPIMFHYFNTLLPPPPPVELDGLLAKLYLEFA